MSRFVEIQCNYGETGKRIINVDQIASIRPYAPGIEIAMSYGDKICAVGTPEFWSIIISESWDGLAKFDWTFPTHWVNEILCPDWMGEFSEEDWQHHVDVIDRANWDRFPLSVKVDKFQVASRKAQSIRSRG